MNKVEEARIVFTTNFKLVWEIVNDVEGLLRNTIIMLDSSDVTNAYNDVNGVA